MNQDKYSRVIVEPVSWDYKTFKEHYELIDADLAWRWEEKTNANRPEYMRYDLITPIRARWENYDRV